MVYDDIQRLYIRERRKLRYVMRFVETKYHFKATEQMYKKRFFKWGFLKNPRHSARASLSSGTDEQGRSTEPDAQHQCRVQRSIPACLDLHHNDALMLVVLRSVKDWSVAFYESIQALDRPETSYQWRPSIKQLDIEKTNEVGLVLKLAVDALARGHGTLAGRIVRKAFLLIEKMFTLEGPALAWNLLVIMHDTVVAHQTRLFEMLLAHILSLARCRMPKTHPFIALLSTLQRIVLNPDHAMNPSGSLSTTSSPRSPTPVSSPEESVTNVLPEIAFDPISTLLERAWHVNADMLFDHLDTGFFQVYCDIDWDSSSIELPTTMVDSAHKWFSGIEEKGRLTATHTTSNAISLNEVEEDIAHERLLAVQISTLSLREFEPLWASSIAALRRTWNAYLHQHVRKSGDSGVLIRSLAGLVTANVMEESLTTFSSLDTTTSLPPEISKLHASHLACVIKATEDLRHILSKDEGTIMPADSIKRKRSTVALFEYAYGETHPRVVQEMRSLQEALTATGNHNEADRVGDHTAHRLEQYLRHIPADATQVQPQLQRSMFAAAVE